MALTEPQKHELNTFQLKGLRQILKIPTTYMDRRNTNEEVRKRANKHFEDKKAAEAEKREEKERQARGGGEGGGADDDVEDGEGER